MISELIQVKENKVMTSSLLVAEKFNKEHSRVTRAIKALIRQLEGITINGDTPYYEECSEINKQNGKAYPVYYMDRDGFTLLAMGFNNTNPDVLTWKITYINAFNEMERRLRNKSPKTTLQDNRLEIARIISRTPKGNLSALLSLFPEYFNEVVEPESLEYEVERNTSYTKWIEEFGIDVDWIGDFPTTDIYNNYARYCKDNRFIIMGKKTFFKTLAEDFHLTKKQLGDGRRYFITA